ncbi:MAG: glycosyltransferase family 2 protein [Gammaproteobacteria bacterium]|nr:glycosyltransferase family 2 protein [Gammaproteobacteria bacterium]
MPKLSAVVTTLNNAKTLEACLGSLGFADEIVLLDSFSSDQTLEIARSHGCRVHQHEFLGYGAQKQSAVEKATHDWILLLDADEAVSAELADEIGRHLQHEPDCAGFALPRLEQLFWRMCSPHTALNHHLRLFDRRRGGLSNMPVHAAPKVDGRVRKLNAVFYHYGEPDIHSKVAKINAYSSGLLGDKLARGKRFSALSVLFYPPFFFFKLYVLKRNFLNGWGGFFTSVIGAFYVFLKYAKLHEHQQFEKYGDALMPDNAPPHPRLDGLPDTPI